MIFKRKNKELPFQIVGIYRYPANEQLFQETLELQWGENLSDEELEKAKAHVSEHFKNLYAIEIVSTQSLAEFDWSTITQEEKGQPRENWQVPYDERQLDDSGCHWVFFFHYLNLEKPLLTPFGKIPLPIPQEMPSHLDGITYEPPG
ncbi:MAG: hypothetical protein FJ012_07870 [Chloroflexi bacterium]|nr:hypothetical protein [Chloroflexota bacterium]